MNITTKKLQALTNLLQPRKKRKKNKTNDRERTFIEIEAVFADVWAFRARGHSEQSQNWYKCFPHFCGRLLRLMS